MLDGRREFWDEGVEGEREPPVRVGFEDDLLGVLDLVSARPLEVRAVHTAHGAQTQTGAPSITTRAVDPRRAP